jgi:hypothetical protein
MLLYIESATNRSKQMNTALSINEVLSFYRRGWMSHAEAVANLLFVAPVRFQRQEHQASSFLALNA